MTYIEFTALAAQGGILSLAWSMLLEFFAASPPAIIFDNLKMAVINGSVRDACFHPEFLALCGHFSYIRSPANSVIPNQKESLSRRCAA